VARAKKFIYFTLHSVSSVRLKLPAKIQKIYSVLVMDGSQLGTSRMLLVSVAIDYCAAAAVVYPFNNRR
jgi:hypothetical protein